MKKLLLLIFISLVSINTNAQKSKKTTAKVSKTNILAKADNVSIEIVKNNFNIYFLTGKLKDSINIKNIATTIPTDCKLIAFSAKGTKLYLLTYVEKSIVKSTNKTEEILVTNSEIYEIVNKTKVFANIQKTTKITEKVFLDRLKNASETQEKMRNEGFIVTLLADGDLSLKTKTQENKMTYDATLKKYNDIKKKK